MNKIRKKRNLDRYLDSRGSELPLDWELYIEGSLHQDLCVFCEEYHVGYIVYKINPVDDSQTDIGIRACEECAQHVEAMLIQEFDLGTDQGIFSERKDPGNTKEDAHVQNLRWKQLVQNLQFDAEAYKYVVHLRPNRDRYITDECNRCYVCTRMAPYHVNSNAYNKWTRIHIPVSNTDTIESGEVFVCDTCTDYDMVDIETTYEYHVQEGLLHVCRCPSCQKRYYIDHEEFEYRQRFEPLPMEPEWLCPECAYNVIDGVQETGSDIKYCVSNEAPRHYPMERFVPCACAMCTKGFDIDLMMTPDHIEIRYRLKEDTFICEGCLEQGIKSFVLNDNVFHFFENFYITMKFDGEFWDYAIIRIGHKKQSLMEELLIGRTDISEPANAVLRAMEETRKIIFGEQAELFGDGNQ